CLLLLVLPSFPTRRSSDLHSRLALVDPRFVSFFRLGAFGNRGRRHARGVHDQLLGAGVSHQARTRGGPSRPPRLDRSSTGGGSEDRKSTRLNFSHEWISYA